MNERNSPKGNAKGGREDLNRHQPKVLHDLPIVQGVRQWSVDPYVEHFREEVEMLRLFSQDAVDQELRWFAEGEYHRAVLQIHVEQVLGKTVKDRKTIYKRWRTDLGDDGARRYAKYAEYVQEHGRPKWFKRELTLYPDTNVLKPSCVSTALPVSLSPSLPSQTVMQNSLL